MGPMDSIRIQLDCKVTRQASAGVTDQFYIRWLRENTTGAVEDLGPGSETHSTNELLSQYRDLINENYKPSFLGKYWCQVINTTADPEQPLMRSNVFTLLAPDSYTARSRCSVQQTVSNTTCADLPAQSDQTTLPVPATTTDTATTQMTTASQGQDAVSE